MNAKRTLIAFALSCALGHAAELHWRNGEMIEYVSGFSSRKMNVETLKVARFASNGPFGM